MRKLRKLIAVIAIFSLLAINGLVQTTNAASLSSAKDRLSDSDVSVAATHNITFTTHTNLLVNEYIEVALPSTPQQFGNVLVGNITCPANTTPAAQSVTTVRCTVLAGGIATGTYAITLANTANPSTVGSYMITISTHQSGGTEREAIDVMVAIVNSVNVSATVASTLTFSIIPLATSTSVNGATTTMAAATSSMAFGTLAVGTSSIMGQELRVITNAREGFTVTLEQDQVLTSASGATIDSFIDGVASTTAAAWQGPAATLDATSTYGHFGYTSEDATLAAGDTYGNNLWKGLTTSTPVEVMYHTGPADGIAPNKGVTRVGYQVQISALQEAGDYNNVLTYIATPTY
ncbi:MAG: hypothetical protein WCK11_03510 [Candidatus Falkowbacteria bacterium]